MGIRPIFALALLALSGVALADKKSCILEKYEKSLPDFKTCYDKPGGTWIPKIKQCWTDSMKPEDVVKVAPDGQMTVDYTNFGNYGTAHSNDEVGKAMTACHQENPQQDRMYEEAARAAQCVFDKLKKNC